MDVELPEDKDAKKEERKQVVPEVEVYLELLVTIFLIDKKDYATVSRNLKSYPYISVHIKTS